MTQALAVDHIPDIKGPAGTRRPPVLAVGVIIWLGSEFMFFSGLFAAFFNIRANAPSWPPAGTDLDYVQASIFSVILLASSATMQKAVFLIEKGRKASAKKWLIVTFFMGFAFVGNQLYEWITLPFSPSASIP